MLSLICFFSVLVMTLSGDTAINERKILIRFRKISKGTIEPLMRFPFIASLVNPCHFESQLFDFWQHHAFPSSMRNLTANGDVPLAQQALDFLIPFRDVIDVMSTHDPLNLDDNRREEQSDLTQELKLVVSQVLLLIHRIYSPSDLRKCRDFQLQSLPRDNLFVVSPTEKVRLEEFYRSLLVIAAHLHVIIYDVRDSAKFCSSESVAHLQVLRQLIGKVETSMCLMLHSAVASKHEENVDYFKVTHEVLQFFLNRYYTCSDREIRECLIMGYTEDIFGFIQCYID